MKNVYVIAQEFSTPGNCGAIARAMKNFEFKSLIFLNPQCDYKSKEAMDRATHAKDILQKAKVMKTFDEVIKKFDYVIATTAKLGTDYNINRSPLTPEELTKIISPKRKYAIVIGREGSGMKNEEIKKCDFIVSVPSSTKYPTLNVSHATTIILYELFKKSKEKKLGEQIKPINVKEKQKLLELIHKTISNLDFKTKENKETQKIIWKRILGKAMLTKREAYALFGFFKKLK